MQRREIKFAGTNLGNIRILFFLLEIYICSNNPQKCLTKNLLFTATLCLKINFDF